MKHLPLLVPLCALAACTAPSSSDPETRSSALAATEWSRLVPWGSAEGEVGLSPAGVEHLAEGPSAVAVDASGAVWLLDRLNGRLARFSPEPGPAPRTVAPADRDAEDLAVGPDGAAALYSPLRSRVVVVDGERRAELEVPRMLPDVVGLALGRSRQVTVFTAEQEHLRLGSPALPQILSAVLHSRRQGAARMDDGSRLATLRSPDGSVRLLHLRSDGSSVEHALPGPALSARVVGAAGAVACARIERAAAASSEVERRAVCLDLSRDETVLDVELGTPGLYVPHRELAVGGGAASPVLAFVRPEKGGLRVTVRSLAAGRGGGR